MAEFQFFKLRLPAQLHKRVSETAAAAGRSINAEVTARLEASLVESKGDALEQILAGNPELRTMALITIGTLDRAGRSMAQIKGMSEGEWMQDRTCFRRAVWSIVFALLGPITPAELDWLGQISKGQAL